VHSFDTAPDPSLSAFFTEHAAGVTKVLIFNNILGGHRSCYLALCKPERDMIDERAYFLLNSALFVLAAAFGGTGFFILISLVGVWTFPPELTAMGLALVLVAMVIQRSTEPLARTR
jgi:hypothetical protein